MVCQCPAWCCDVYVPRRYVIIVLMCLGMLIIHAQRVNVAVTVVTILNEHAHQIVGTSEAVSNLPDKDWGSMKIGFLHAVFYIGYLLTQLPGGYLATKIPSHRLFGGCILMSCALNLLIPACIDALGYDWACVVRFLQGLSEGILFPSCYALLRHWTTAEERSRMGAIVLTGVYMGPVMGLIVSGYITNYYGWQLVFYGHGGTGVFWFFIWLFLSYEKPSYHPGINEQELNMILKSQGETSVMYQEDDVPWKEIFLSLPVNALNVCNFARSFIFFLLLTNEPAYLNVFGYSIAENGFLSSLPHAMMGAAVVLSGPLADLMMKNPMLTPTQVRKMFTCLGFGMEAICLFFLGFIEFGTPALIFLIIGVGGSGATISGWQINHLDLAPRHAGILVAITTAVGTLAGILVPVIVGSMTKDQSIHNWQNVFFLSSAVCAFAVVFYGIFGSGEKQPWAEPRDKVRIVDRTNPLERKPYGTFAAQLDPDGTMPSDVVPNNATDAVPDEPKVTSSDRAQLVRSVEAQMDARDPDVSGSKPKTRQERDGAGDELETSLGGNSQENNQDIIYDELGRDESRR